MERIVLQGDLKIVFSQDAKYGVDPVLLLDVSLAEVSQQKVS